MSEPVIYWLRNDLRLTDNPALTFAAAKGLVLPLYIYEEEEAYAWSLGGASKWWLYHALSDLKLPNHFGHNLVLEMGEPLAILRKWIALTGARVITWNRRYEPRSIERDTEIKNQLHQEGISVVSHNGSLLNEPWEIKTGAGHPYKVYTPYAKACFARSYAKALPSPPLLNLYKSETHGDNLEAILLPKHPDWSAGLGSFWDPTQKGYRRRISHLKNIIHDYRTLRDVPSQDGTSRLSPYLHFGQVSPRWVWHEIADLLVLKPEASQGGECFLRELLWREFSYYLLYHFPGLPENPWDQRFSKFPWATNVQNLRTWQKGMTGYPFIDAGLRQLWQTGWMHNRVRMVVASFLVKDLMIPWQKGEAWFWDTLVDADLASNAAGWQWVAGSGADASPYFRIFNPVTQSKKFDPDGTYIKTYVPELRSLDPAHIHEPWRASKELLKAANIELGKDYPYPMIDHDQVRKEALSAYKSIARS